VYKNVFIPPGDYHWTRHQLTYGSPQDRRLMMSFFERFGTYYNRRLMRPASTTYRSSERSLSTSSSNRFRLLSQTVISRSCSAVFQTNYSFSRFSPYPHCSK
jgi:hypothetical protein